MGPDLNFELNRLIKLTFLFYTVNQDNRNHISPTINLELEINELEYTIAYIMIRIENLYDFGRLLRTISATWLMNLPCPNGLCAGQQKDFQSKKAPSVSASYKNDYSKTE